MQHTWESTGRKQCVVCLIPVHMGTDGHFQNASCLAKGDLKARGCGRGMAAKNVLCLMADRLYL